MIERKPSERDLFVSALQLDPGEERRRFLETACAGDEQLRSRLEVLLDRQASDDGDDFLEPISSPLDLWGREPSPLEASSDFPIAFGDYELLEVLGRGAMGVVYRARQRSLNRVVAVKLVRGALLVSESDLVRFRQEAEAAAGLDHPNIVPVFEVGVFEHQLYFSMKLLARGSMAERMDELRGELPAAVGMLIKIARALQVAHQNGIIHRDLKPSNILLDESGEPYLADFGLAKDTGSRRSLTLNGQIIGTPSYMAPEQARSGEQVTTLADIYSLGAILYELLTGVPPFSGDSLVGVLEQLRHEEVMEPRKRNPEVDPDLQTIVLKCLEKDPADRYASAAAVVDELERWQHGFPIQARPIPFLERTRRWFRRHPWEGGLSIALVILLVALAIGGPLMAWRQSELRNEAIVAESKEREARLGLRRNLYAAEMRLACQLAQDATGVGRLAELLEYWSGNGDAEDLRGWEWYYLQSLTRRQVFSSPSPGGSAKVNQVAWSPDGKRILIGFETGQPMELWNRETGVCEQRFPERAGKVDWLEDGRRLRITTLALEGKVLNAEDGTVTPESSLPLDHPGASLAAWSPDGRYLAFAEEGGQRPLHLWDSVEKRFLPPLPGTAPTQALAWSPDGTWLAFGGLYDGCRLWNSETREEVPFESSELADGLASLAWVDRGDGPEVAIGSVRNELRIRRVPDGKLVTRWQAHAGPVTACAWSPDGRWLATGARDQSVRVWDARSGFAIATFGGHTDLISQLTWSPDGKYLGSGSRDGTARIWDIEGNLGNVKRLSNRPAAVSWSPDGKTVLVAGISEKTPLGLWNLETGGIIDLPGGPGWIVTTDWNARTGLILAGGSNEFSPSIWDPGEASPVPVSNPFRSERRYLYRACWNPGGNRIVASLIDGSAVRIDHPGGSGTAFGGGKDSILSVAWSPDGVRIATGGYEGQFRLWDAESLELLAADDSPGQVESIDWSADGSRVAVGRGDGTIGIWSLEALNWSALLKGHTQGVETLDWSPDGKRLASGSRDQTIRLWDAGPSDPSWLTVAILRRHQGEIRAIAWSPDGRKLLSAGSDLMSLIWSADS